MSEPKQNRLYLIFHSIHNVMLAEELLLEAGIANEMVPVPREISSDCGMSLTCTVNDLENIKSCLEKAKFTTPYKIYNYVHYDQKRNDFKLYSR